MSNADGLPVVQAAELAPEHTEGPGWLADGLWIDQGVGVLGGTPKLGKSWLALDLAVSLASGTPCLGAFAVPKAGKVLLYAAEDGPAIVRSRLEAICAHRRLELSALSLYAITAETLRLDTADGQTRLARTVERLQPALLILDPFVRVYGRIDENSVSEVSALLAYLRGLQRSHGCAVLLVHHVRKNGSAGAPGQALRGSSDIHAWGDGNLYMRRKGTKVTLTIEHRCASSPPPLPLQLVADDPATVHLELLPPGRPSVADDPPAGGSSNADPATSAAEAPDDFEQSILALLRAASPSPTTRAALRQALSVRNQRVGQALERLEQEGRVSRGADGWVLAEVPDSAASASADSTSTEERSDDSDL